MKPMVFGCSGSVLWAIALLVGPVSAIAAEISPASTAPKLVPNVSWMQWGLALMLVFGALAVFFLLLRQLSGVAGLGSRHLKVLSGISLGARERVVLLQTGNKQLVLGVSPGRIQTLCVLEGEDRVSVDTPTEPATGDSPFSRVFNQLLAQKQTTP